MQTAEPENKKWLIAESIEAGSITETMFGRRPALNVISPERFRFSIKKFLCFTHKKAVCCKKLQYFGKTAEKSTVFLVDTSPDKNKIVVR